MDKSKLMDAALAALMDDMDDMEGTAATAHSQEECPDPLGCKMHDAEAGDSLSGLPEGDKSPAALTIEVKKGGLPSMEGELGEGKGAEEGLSPDEQELMKKLLA